MAAYSKTFILLGLLLALVLILSTQASARELAEVAQTQGSVEEHKHWRHGHDHWGYGHHHHSHHRHHRQGHGHHGEPGHDGAGEN